MTVWWLFVWLNSFLSGDIVRNLSSGLSCDKHSDLNEISWINTAFLTFSHQNWAYGPQSISLTGDTGSVKCCLSHLSLTAFIWRPELSWGSSRAPQPVIIPCWGWMAAVQSPADQCHHLAWLMCPVLLFCHSHSKRTHTHTNTEGLSKSAFRHSDHKGCSISKHLPPIMIEDRGRRGSVYSALSLIHTWKPAPLCNVPPSLSHPQEILFSTLVSKNISWARYERGAVTLNPS